MVKKREKRELPDKIILKLPYFSGRESINLGIENCGLTEEECNALAERPSRIRLIYGEVYKLTSDVIDLYLNPKTTTTIYERDYEAF